MDEEKKIFDKNEEKNLAVLAFEKIGVLEKEVENEKEEKKTLKQRIKDLVMQMEKVNKVITKQFSFKRIFIRGLLQGLGFVIGSTLIAGGLYSMAIKMG